ncbi:hypothetical protein MY5147_009485 [Beauveria neobassiana]
MSLSDHPRAYGSAALVAAFAAGILVTLGFKDAYPDLESRFQEKHRGAGKSRKGLRPRRSSIFWGAPVTLEDHEQESSSRSDGIAEDGIVGCIGNTPLIKIRSLSEATGRTVLAKAEFLNGAGNSPKDRVALSIIRAAEAQGLLTPRRGDTIYEGTVGSTGISLATLARALGYRAHICMPDDQSREKSDLLLRLGATVERVPVAPITSPDHFVNLARRRAAEHAARREDKAKSSSVRIVLADPQGSGLYNKVKHGVMYSPTEREGTRRRQQVDSMVEGIGVNRVTANFEAGRDLIDDAVKVTDEQACRMARWLVEKDGIFVGSSSAVNCVAAVVTARTLPPGSVVVTVLCDSGTRHLSKFWKHIEEMGRDEDEPADLFAELGLEQQAEQ